MARQRSKTALVLAGGGIMGAAYEIGCLTALDRLFAPGFSSRRFDMFVGISAGSVIATLLANRIQPAGLFTTITRNERTVFNWRRSDIYRVDWLELLKACFVLPFSLAQVIRNYRRNDWPLAFGDLPHLLHELFPSGLFALDPMQDYLCRSFQHEGILDDFDSLGQELYIPAYDLDSGARVVFGTDGFRNTHICQAITASCAIPFFFQPYRIGEQAFIDGSVGLISHLDIAIDRGAQLIVVVNPRTPFHNNPEQACLPTLSSGKCSKIADLGILFAWEQSRRIEAQQTLVMELAHYRQLHPEIDILLFEPGVDESLLFFQGPMSIKARTQVMQQGYYLTLAALQERYEEFTATFARHAINTTKQRLHQPMPE